MSKQTIEIDVPDGYEIVGYAVPKKGDYYLSICGAIQVLEDLSVLKVIILKKAPPPRRRVFECVSEEPREVTQGEMYENHCGVLAMWDNKSASGGIYRVFKEVT